MKCGAAVRGWQDRPSGVPSDSRPQNVAPTLAQSPLGHVVGLCGDEGLEQYLTERRAIYRLKRQQIRVKSKLEK